MHNRKHVWFQELPTKGMADSASRKTLTKLKYGTLGCMAHRIGKNLWRQSNTGSKNLRGMSCNMPTVITHFWNYTFHNFHVVQCRPFFYLSNIGTLFYLSAHITMHSHSTHSTRCYLLYATVHTHTHTTSMYSA